MLAAIYAKESDKINFEKNYVQKEKVSTILTRILTEYVDCRTNNSKYKF